MIVLNKEKLEALGAYLKGKFDIYDKERHQIEQQWLRNLRQYKAIYDPEIIIPAGMSKVYPKDTHTKIVGWVAKMMEMMFPAQEKNWSLGISPFPNIAEQDLQSILDILAAQQQQIAEQTGQPVQAPTSDQIEKAVKEFAEQRATRMEMECHDQLVDENVDYPELCKKVIRRGGIYGFGIAEGPQVKTQRERVWEPDATGRIVAVEKKLRRPYYTVLKPWDTYPDLSAQTWAEQEGLFTRRAVARHSLQLLAERDDFFGEVINDYLRDHAGGNYKARSFEAELNVIKKVSDNPVDTAKRQFEILRWYGFVSAQDLRDVGVTVPDSAIGKDILADVWLLDNIPIKADTAPFGEKVSDMFHVFIPEEDEDAPLTGSSKVENLRDSALKLASIDRATMDNMAAIAGPILEVNDDLLKPGEENKVVRAWTTLHRTGEGNEANYPVIRDVQIDSHISELLELRKSVLEVFDVESNLPSWRMGNAQPLGEAFRTSNNMSMMAGGGDMVTKDDVRSFDRFIKSLISSLVKWNMEFNEKTDIKGDFQVMPKGSISLVAKEVRGAALDQLVGTLTPRQLVMVDERGLLEDRFLARDLPTSRLKSKEEATQALQQYDAAQAQAAQIQQGLDTSKTQLQLAGAQEKAAKAEEITQTLTTKVNEGLSRIAQNLAKAKGTKDGTALQQIKLLLDQVNAGAEGGGAGKGAEGATTSE